MKFYLSLFLILCAVSTLAQTGELRGIIREDSTNKVIRFASLMIYQHDSLIGETVSDSLGRYIFKNLSWGKYDVFCEKKNFRGIVVRNVLITVDKISFFNFSLKKLNSPTDRNSTIDTVVYPLPIISKAVVY
jgi:hypothetical protein